MQFNYNKSTLKIDNGDHYYTALVTEEMFPEEIRDNFEEIIQQSFNNYSDTQYSVTHSFENNTFTIHFNYKVKPFTFKRNVVINMDHHLKDYKDYTNERIEKLEAQVKMLTSQLESVTNKLNMLVDDNTDTEEENDTDEDDDDDNVSEEAPSILAKVVTKTTKKVTQQTKPSGKTR